MRIREHVADTTEASEKERERKRSHQTNFNPLTEIVRLCRAVPRSHPVGADSRPAPHAAERLIDRRAAARSPHEQGEAGARGEHGCWGGEGSTREGKETASFFHSLTRSLARAKRRKMKKKMPSGHFGFLPYFFSFDPVDDPDDRPPQKKAKWLAPSLLPPCPPLLLPRTPPEGAASGGSRPLSPQASSTRPREEEERLRRPLSVLPPAPLPPRSLLRSSRRTRPTTRTLWTR